MLLAAGESDEVSRGPEGGRGRGDRGQQDGGRTHRRGGGGRALEQVLGQQLPVQAVAGVLGAEAQVHLDLDLGNRNQENVGN